MGIIPNICVLYITNYVEDQYTCTCLCLCIIYSQSVCFAGEVTISRALATLKHSRHRHLFLWNYVPSVMVILYIQIRISSLVFLLILVLTKCLDVNPTALSPMVKLFVIISYFVLQHHIYHFNTCLYHLNYESLFYCDIAMLLIRNSHGGPKRTYSK